MPLYRSWGKVRPLSSLILVGYRYEELLD